MVSAQQRFGAIPPAVAKLATSPRLLNGFLQASRSFEEATLPAVAREVVVMTLAVRHGCGTCVAIHSRILARLGRSDLVPQLQDDAPLPEPELDAVRVFVHRVLDRAGQVSDEQLQEFVDAGYTPEHVLEVVFGIGTYTMSVFANRLLRV